MTADILSAIISHIRIIMPRRRKHSFDPVLSRGIIAIILVIFAVIIGLSFFDKAGFVGEMLDGYVLSFLFGSIRYAAPFILLILAWFLVRDIDYAYNPTHIIGAVLFFLAMSSLMHINFLPREMWRQALEGHGGGVFGMLAWPLKNYLGIIGGSVILVGLVAASLVFIFNASLGNFVEFNRRLFSWFARLFASLGSALNKGKASVRVNGDYEKYEEEEDEEYEDEEEDEEDEEEELTKRRFFSKKVSDDQEESSYAEASEAEDEEESDEGGEQSSPWTKKVIIKDLPPLKLLSDKKSKPTSGDIEANAGIIQDTLEEFKVEVEMGEIRVGPTVTQYSLRPAKGIKLSRITALSNDLALALAAHPIRIEAPIPGKSLVGIEVPNHKAARVTLKELLASKEFKNRGHNLMMALGKDVAGKVWFADLPKMPHLLVAGATGSGKTVCINTIIMSLLYQNTAEILRFIMVDPKRVELPIYNGIPHLLTPVITNVPKTVNALKWTIGEMDRRFEILAGSNSRDIYSYNKKYPHDKIPQIVFIIDELADLMAAAASEVEAGIIRLAQMSRATGIHLVLATQRPSVDIITGLMKANIPARIAFSVASIIDSRTILDCPGAEKLLGRGDMLFLTSDLGKPKRIQGAFVSEDEVKRVVDYLRGDEAPEYDDSIVEKPQSGGTLNMFGGPSDDQDPLFEEAKQAILDAGKASASFLQRRLKIGYARAARILDELEAAGIIGPADGAKPREILQTEREMDEEIDRVKSPPEGGSHAAGEYEEDEELDEYEEEYEEDDDEDYEEDEEDDEDLSSEASAEEDEYEEEEEEDECVEREEF